MHAKLTLPWRTPKRNNERKRRKTNLAEKNYIHTYTYSTLWNFDATTSNVRHRNTVADMKYATRPQQVEGPPSCRHTVSLVSQSLIPVKDSVRDTFFCGKKKIRGKKNKNELNVREHLESGGSSPGDALIKLCHCPSNIKSGNAPCAYIAFSFMHFNPNKKKKNMNNWLFRFDISLAQQQTHIWNIWFSESSLWRRKEVIGRHT